MDQSATLQNKQFDQEHSQLEVDSRVEEEKSKVFATKQICRQEKKSSQTSEKLFQKNEEGLQHSRKDMKNIHIDKIFEELKKESFSGKSEELASVLASYTAQMSLDNQAKLIRVLQKNFEEASENKDAIPFQLKESPPIHTLFELQKSAKTVTTKYYQGSLSPQIREN
eukprot:TRINITY_DN2963_c0_g1_i1.p3 TRINITY_DN2963_c0_g1~~TRINITY_DN2963_c0_g1_i1.p3  ORF type:complete len:168 (-),score=34.79 TRINITY_DN2963_c0_g1_i1:426-929(-)